MQYAGNLGQRVTRGVPPWRQGFDEFLERQVRAYDPWPGSFLTWSERRILVLQTAVSTSMQNLPAGQVVEQDGLPAVVTSEGLLKLLKIQPAGKNPMDGAAFMRGAPNFVGSNLESGDS